MQGYAGLCRVMQGYAELMLCLGGVCQRLLGANNPVGGVTASKKHNFPHHLAFAFFARIRLAGSADCKKTTCAAVGRSLNSAWGAAWCVELK